VVDRGSVFSSFEDEISVLAEVEIPLVSASKMSNFSSNGVKSFQIQLKSVWDVKKFKEKFPTGMELPNGEKIKFVCGCYLPSSFSEVVFTAIKGLKPDQIVICIPREYKIHTDDFKWVDKSLVIAIQLRMLSSFRNVELNTQMAVLILNTR